MTRHHTHSRRRENMNKPLSAARSQLPAEGKSVKPTVGAGCSAGGRMAVSGLAGIGAVASWVGRGGSGSDTGLVLARERNDTPGNVLLSISCPLAVVHDFSAAQPR